MLVGPAGTGKSQIAYAVARILKLPWTTFNTQYDTIQFDGKSVLMSNASTFAVMNLKGKMLTTQNFDLPIESVLPMGTRGRYIMVNSKYIQDIRLQ